MKGPMPSVPSLREKPFGARLSRGSTAEPPRSFRRRAERTCGVNAVHALDLPAHMTANALLEFINAVGTHEQVAEIIQQYVEKIEE